MQTNMTPAYASLTLMYNIQFILKVNKGNQVPISLHSVFKQRSICQNYID